MSQNNRMRSEKATELKDIIEERINTNFYTDKIPGITTLAAEFKVNKNTVNKSLGMLVREGKIVRRAGFGTFIAGTFPEEKATFKKVASRRYAFLISKEEQFQGYLRLLDGSNEIFSELQGLVTYVRYDSTSDPERLLGRLRELQIEGVLICSYIPSTIIEMLYKEFNIISVDSPPPNDMDIDAIVWDNFQIGYELARLLHENGIENFCTLHFTVPESDVNEPILCNEDVRIAGIKKYCKDYKLSYKPYDSDWKLSNLSPTHPLAEEIRKSPETTAYISFQYLLTTPCFLKLGLYQIMPKVQIASTITQHQSPYALPGFYAVLNTYDMGVMAAKSLINTVGRAKDKRKTLTMTPEFIHIKSQ
ncbi:MAG: GntR family transcriptional regulator [Lentisphaeria bacterium]|nr:GntR family transcriptional regulator [Lentisphaeria bacterium]